MKSANSKIEAALAFRAFSDPTRLRILHLLLNGELCVCDLVEILKTPQPTASRHLAYLRRANLVKTRNQGQWTFYTLAPARTAFHKQLLACLSQCATATPAIARDRDKLKNFHRSANCCL